MFSIEPTDWWREWKRLLHLTWEDTPRFLGAYRIVQITGLGVAVAIYLAFLRRLPVSAHDLEFVTLSGLFGGMTAWLGTFLWRLSVAIPSETRARSAEIDTLTQEKKKLESAAKEDLPDFSTSEIVRIQLDGDHERPDWIKLIVHITLRNRGNDSGFERWRLAVETTSGFKIVHTVESLSPADEHLAAHLGGNLLHDKKKIEKRTSYNGYLLLHVPKKDMGGLTTGRESTVTVAVDFADADAKTYRLSYPLLHDLLWAPRLS